jgi:hypothetical protein
MSKQTSKEETLKIIAVEVVGGGVAGAVAAATNIPAPHFEPHVLGAANAAARGANAATQSFRHHHKVIPAALAGTASIIGHGAVGVAIAPYALGAAAAGAVGYGAYKLVGWLRRA